MLRGIRWIWHLMRLAGAVGRGRQRIVKREAERLLELDPEDSLARHYLEQAEEALRRR